MRPFPAQGTQARPAFPGHGSGACSAATTSRPAGTPHDWVADQCGRLSALVGDDLVNPPWYDRNPFLQLPNQLPRPTSALASGRLPIIGVCRHRPLEETRYEERATHHQEHRSPFATARLKAEGAMGPGSASEWRWNSDSSEGLGSIMGILLTNDAGQGSKSRSGND
jgi:hypothetical protein